MALVVLPEGTQISGSIGGTTWSHNRAGAYKRNRSVPVNPNTARQQAVRNAVTSISIAWDLTLTQAQRDAWNVYAANVNWTNKLGQSIKLTGLNHYIRSNTPLVQNGIARVDVAPAQQNIGTAELELAVSASEATQQLTINGQDPVSDPWIGIAGAWMFVAMGLPQNSGIAFFGGPYRQITAIPGAGPPPFPAIVATAFPFSEGQRIWAKCRIARADGRLSDFAEVNFLAIA